MNVDHACLGESDVLDEEADHSLAFALRSGRVRPQHGEVGRKLANASLVFFTESASCCSACSFVIVLRALELAQRVVPVGFEGVGHEPVVRIDRQVATPCQLGSDGAPARREFSSARRLHRRELPVRIAP